MPVQLGFDGRRRQLSDCCQFAAAPGCSELSRFRVEPLCGAHACKRVKSPDGGKDQRHIPRQGACRGERGTRTMSLPRTRNILVVAMALATAMFGAACTGNVQSVPQNEAAVKAAEGNGGGAYGGPGNSAGDYG